MSSNPEPSASVRPVADIDAWLEFEAVIDEHRGELYAFAYRLLGDRAEADDALQNAYLKAFEVSRRDVQVESTLPWLYRVVYRCCIDELRRAKRTTHDVLDEAVDAAAQPDAGVTRALSAALLALPPASRAAVLLVDVHGLSYDEAAEALELPRGTVASRLNHGRRELRVILADYRPETGRQP